ncbi:MAG: DNA polymerase III subunit beta [Bacillota bacterium]
MKFIIEQSVFHNALKKVNRAISSNNTLPILSGLLLQSTQNNDLKLIATDLEIGIELEIGANIDQTGAIVLPANEISNIVRELPAEPVRIEVNQDNYQAKIETSTSHFKLNGFNPDEFPSLPEVEDNHQLNISADQLKNMIDEVKFSCDKNNSQPGLTGALFSIKENKIVMVATNTYRMAYSEMNLNHDISEEIRIIIPANSLNELSNLLNDYDDEKINVIIDNSHIKFFLNDVIFTSRLIEGKFPNYQQVMPNEYNNVINIDKDKLLQAVKRTALIAKLDSGVISLKFSQDKLIIESVNSDKGHAREEVNIEMEGGEQNINIDVNYLMDVLKIISEETIRFELIGPLNPLTVKRNNKNDYIYLIMPVRPGS